jgi:hypothetical protein
VCLPIVTWLTGFHSRALCLPAVHPWRDPCRRVSGDGMRVEPSLMHHEGGSWTAVRTHTPSKLSKVQRTFVSHPLGLLQVSGERITAPSEPDVPISRHGGEWFHIRQKERCYRNRFYQCLKTLPFLRHCPTFGLHYIDYALPQVYNAFIIIVPCKH